MLLLPFVPALALNFKSLSQFTSLRNSSCFTLHPNESEENVPQRLSDPNFEEPSRLTLADKMYFSL